MTATELLAALQKAPAAIAEASALAMAASLVVGGVGTALETFGVATSQLWLERFGQRLEAIGTDVPKLLRGSRYTNDIVATADKAAKSLSGEP